MSKSYWKSMRVHTDSDKRAIKNWFAPVCNDMTPESAEILCDKQTDREKKLRAVMIDGEGVKRIATRTLGGRTFTVTLKRVAA